VYYALGVNAASAGKIRDAADYLKQAAAASPDRSQEKAETLLQRLW
jgi:hypothetical protein